MLASSTEGAQNVGCGGKSQRFRWQTHLAIDGILEPEKNTSNNKSGTRVRI